MNDAGEAAAKETMQLLKPESWSNRFKKKRLRSLGRFFRKIHLRRSRRKRAAYMLFLFLAILYLSAVGAYRDIFLSVKEQTDVQTVLEYSGEKVKDVLNIFRISIRLKSGEIVFFHERTERDEIP